jgi:uncharacterized repeat protein (TIGR03943 family)
VTGETTGAVTAIVGVMAVRLALTDEFLHYLRPGMKWPLVLAGAVLVVLGGATIVRAFARRDDQQTLEPHDGHRLGPIAWLLLLPVVVLFAVAPKPLGTDAIDTSATRAVGRPARFAPLPSMRDGAYELSIRDVLERATFEPDSLTGATVRVVGFVSNNGAPVGALLLTRFVLTCCAADAYAVQLAVAGSEAFADDTWIEVTGRLRGAPIGQRTTVDVVSVRRISRPANPYE